MDIYRNPYLSLDLGLKFKRKSIEFKSTLKSIEIHSYQSISLRFKRTINWNWTRINWNHYTFILEDLNGNQLDPKLFQPWSLKIDQPLDHGMLFPECRRSRDHEICTDMLIINVWYMDPIYMYIYIYYILCVYIDIDILIVFYVYIYIHLSYQEVQ